MAGEIFISYRRADQAKARLLHALLKQRGVDAWYDALLGAGEDWRHKTAHALETAPIFVLLFSKVASESDDISKELAAATFSKKTVIPVRIENIMPSGAFLYELASRNWFDAYEDTEKKFEELADKLAALVKGGPEAEVAAFSLGAEAAPVVKPAAKPLFKQPLMLGGIAVAVVALVAAAMMMLAPKPPAAKNQRLAFFGITATDSGAPEQVARIATDETYSTLSAFNIETIPQADAEGVPLKDQLTRATARGARFVLAGEVGAIGDQVTVTMRLDDTQTRANLWRYQLQGAAKQVESLPFRAAARATTTVLCLIEVHEGMEREDAAALRLVAQACATNDVFEPQTLAHWRPAIEVAPRSVVALSIIGIQQILLSIAANPAERLTMLRDAREFFERAKAIEPGRVDLRAGIDMADVASERRLVEIVDDLLAMLGVGADRSKRHSISNVALIRIALLSALGRFKEGARLTGQELKTDPLNAPLQSVYAGSQYALGQVPEARRLYQSVNRRFGDPAGWADLAFLTIFEGDDFKSIAEAAPPEMPPETIACWEDAAKAARSSDTNIRMASARRMQVCMGDDATRATTIAVIAGLGDVSAAFEALEPVLDRSNPFAFILYGRVLFLPHLEALRADPRFLPLVMEAGIYQYWIDAKTPPDMCARPEESEFEVCRRLHQDLGLP